MKHALLKNGVVVNIIDAPVDWAPPAGHTLELYDRATHQLPAPPPPPPKEVETWLFFSLFTAEEHARYFAAIAADNTSIKALDKMLSLQSGGKIQADHPIVQYGLYVCRLSGIIDSDERMAEFGNILQGAAS